MDSFATIDDIEALWRPISNSEKQRATALLPVISDTLRQAAKDAGLDLDTMIADGDVYESVVKSVVVDVTARTLMTSTNAEPMSQFSQTAGPYTQSGTFLVPGGGLFIKRDELARIGIKRKQRMTMIDADLGVYNPPGE